ncbi:hypothetical protein GJ688_05125 [Heliobacillus mobilis]|uniref:Lipoprotein n=1 Tax=Heliobacterium mobile TaxID=28064 RepID=A0A6I3SHK9_HELMO|nr:hypothetical protein [Heliobacterium mobile]MTV48363.1 hypothetical protein [Heliobacterium mobile]
MKRWLMVSLIVFSSILFGCNQTNNSNPVNTSTSQESESIVVLGNSIEDVLSAYGNPKNSVEPLDEDGYGGGYEWNMNNNCELSVLSVINHRIQSFQLVAPENTFWSESEALNFARKLTPKDSIFLKVANDNSIKYFYYKSPTLAKYFEDEWYEGSNGKVTRGVFSVQLRLSDSSVDCVNVETGSYDN